MVADSALDLTPLTGTFGAELHGVDPADGLDPAALKALLHRHRVLVFRGCAVSRDAQVRLARGLGEPTPAHPVVPGTSEHPEILELDGAKGGRNARWHTDVTFVVAPPAYSVLVADHVPAFGGDTQWADLCGAYDRLAPGLQALVDGLDAVHRISPLAYWGEPFDTALSRDDARELFERAATVPPVIHPVVRVHPHTGRRGLFVNPGFTSHLVGLSRIESDGLLRLLHEHATQPELVVRHRWRPGDVVLWDNHATMHYAVDDYGDAERRMRRVTVRGDAPVGPDGRVSQVVTDPLLAVR
jgi:taurine dioxygenase